jgi:hypothetical protein
VELKRFAECADEGFMVIASRIVAVDGRGGLLGKERGD